MKTKLNPDMFDPHRINTVAFLGKPMPKGGLVDPSLRQYKKFEASELKKCVYGNIGRRVN